MGLGHSPRIVTDGLMLAFDMGNPQKSWKGKPTTNINSEQGLVGVYLTLTYVGLENGWKKYSINGTWNAGTYPYSMYITHTTLTGGVGYSAQCLLKTNVRNKFAYFGQINYVNDPNMVSAGTTTVTTIGYENGLEIVSNKRENFIYSTTYANPTTYQPGYLVTMPVSNGTVFNSATDFVWIKNVQVEQSAFCTPFVSDTRSNTQSLIDVTGRNTITASSLTYTSDGAFSFNGVNDYIQTSYIPSNTGGSIDVWVKVNSHKDYNTIFDNAVGANDWEFWVYATGVARFRSSADNTDYILDSDVLSINTWYNFVITWNSTEAKMYKNGILFAQDTSSGTKVTPSNLYFGGGNAGNTKLNGRIEKISIYNRVLSAAEVQQNFNALRGRFGI